jgi:hypothetical protein
MVLLVTRLIDGCPLSDAVIMATPDNVGALRKVEYALDGFAVEMSNYTDVKWEVYRTES